MLNYAFSRPRSWINSLASTMKDYTDEPEPEPEASQEINMLENLRRAVWGNPAAFMAHVIAQDDQSVVGYLDLGHHLAAVQVIFPGVDNKEILVLRGYQDAMDTLRHEMVTCEQGACISGQQRVGKSTFLVYALIERLREQQPVAVQTSWGGEYILFTQHGTSIHNSRDSLSLMAYESNLWALCDAKPNRHEPIYAFQNAVPRGVRVFLTVTESNRCGSWATGRAICRYVLDLWSIREIEHLGFVLKYNRNTIDTMVSHAAQYGTLPGLVTKVLTNPRIMDHYQKEVDWAIHYAISHPDDALEALFKDNSPNIGPSAVFFIKPDTKGDIVNHHTYQVVVPTRWLQDRLGTSVKRAQNAKKSGYLSIFGSHPRTSASAGWILEEIVHEFLGSTTSIHVRWYDDPPRTIKFPQPLDIRTDQSHLDMPPSFYWHPSKSNQPGIDGAIFTEHHVYLVQATASRTHPDPQAGINGFWNTMPENKKCLPCKLIFIGVSDDQIDAASLKYAHSLKYGGASKAHLPIGHFAMYCNAIPLAGSSA